MGLMRSLWVVSGVGWGGVDVGIERHGGRGLRGKGAGISDRVIFGITPKKKCLASSVQSVQMFSIIFILIAALTDRVKTTPLTD